MDVPSNLRVGAKGNSFIYIEGGKKPYLDKDCLPLKTTFLHHAMLPYCPSLFAQHIMHPSEGG